MMAVGFFLGLLTAGPFFVGAAISVFLVSPTSGCFFFFDAKTHRVTYVFVN
jgi:hypothetical protein